MCERSLTHQCPVCTESVIRFGAVSDSQYSSVYWWCHPVNNKMHQHHYKKSPQLLLHFSHYSPSLGLQDSSVRDISTLLFNCGETGKNAQNNTGLCSIIRIIYTRFLLGGLVVPSCPPNPIILLTQWSPTLDKVHREVNKSWVPV